MHKKLKWPVLRMNTMKAIQSASPGLTLFSCVWTWKLGFQCLLTFVWHGTDQNELHADSRTRIKCHFLQCWFRSTEPLALVWTSLTSCWSSASFRNIVRGAYFFQLVTSGRMFICVSVVHENVDLSFSSAIFRINGCRFHIFRLICFFPRAVSCLGSWCSCLLSMWLCSSSFLGIFVESYDDDPERILRKDIDVSMGGLYTCSSFHLFRRKENGR